MFSTLFLGLLTAICFLTLLEIRREARGRRPATTAAHGGPVQSGQDGR